MSGWASRTKCSSSRPEWDANIFRPWGWQGALIVSERFKLALEEEGLSGLGFMEV